jgi:hypothetical protein
MRTARLKNLVLNDLNIASTYPHEQTKIYSGVLSWAVKGSENYRPLNNLI